MVRAAESKNRAVVKEDPGPRALLVKNPLANTETSETTVGSLGCGSLEEA